MTANPHECAVGARSCTPRNLAEVLHCVSRHSNVATKALAQSLEVRYHTLIKWTEPYSHALFPARKLAALARLTGRTDHLEFICAEAGLMVVRRESVGSGNRIVELLDLMRAVGELAAAEQETGHAQTVDDQQRVRLQRLVHRIGCELAEYEYAIGTPAQTRRAA